MNFLKADVAVVVDASKLPAQLAKIKASVTRTIGKIQKSFKKMGVSFKKVFDKMVRVAKYAAVGIVAALTVVARAAMKQEDAIFLLNAALKISGEFTEELSQQFIDFAAEIQQTTIYGDEFVLSLMQQQKSLGVLADSLENAAKMAIGLATATGRGIESMSMYVALAMQGEFTMLQRYIPALRTAKSETEKLAIVTKFAADGFKLAQERALTTSGKLRQLWNTLGDVAEVIGGPMLDSLAELSDKLMDNRELFLEWGRELGSTIKTIIEWFVKWRKEISITLAALAGMVVIAKIMDTFKKFGFVVVWATAAFTALIAVFVKWKTILLLFYDVSLSWAVSIKVLLYAMAISLKSIAILFAKIVIPAFTVIQLTRVVLKLREWKKALGEVIKTEEKLVRVLERAAKNRFESRMKELDRKWPEVKPWPEDLRDPFKAVVPEDQKRFEQMKAALQFEFDMLGKIDDERERAIELSKVQVELDGMANLTADGRNQKLAEYMDLLDRVQEKQKSFSHTIQLWINDSIEWGKNLGEIMTGAFDKASDALADFVLTGKADFASLANSIVSDMTRMIIKAEMAQALGIFMPGLSGGGGAFGGRGLIGELFGVGGKATPELQSGGTVERTGLAKVHKGETFSGVGRESGGKNTITINVNAIDAAGTYQFLNENKRTIATMLQGTIASNHSIRRSNGWKS